MTNLLIDGSSLLHRSHWVNQSKSHLDSNDLGDVYIFLNSLKSYARQFRPDCTYVAWDKKILYPSTNFRNAVTKGEYKNNRDKDKAYSVYSNEEVLIEILNSLGIKNMYPRIMEADDVIAWLSKELSDDTNIIVSTDGDLIQLVDTNVKFWHPQKKILIDKFNFEKCTGLSRECYVPYKAILGDISDNIMGLRGYGKVKAKKLAEQYVSNRESIDWSYLPKIDENIRLMDLSKGYEYAGEEEVLCYIEQKNNLADRTFNKELFTEYCEKCNFNSAINGMDEWVTLFSRSKLLAFLS